MKTKAHKLLSLLFLLAFLPTVFSQGLKLGNSGSIENLNITLKTESFDRGTNSLSVTAKLLPEAIELYKTADNCDKFRIENCLTSGTEGNPVTYIYPVQVKLPKGSVITGIELTNGNYKEVLQKVNPTPRKRAVRWTDQEEQQRTTIKNKEVYEKDALFPSNALTFISGHDNNNTVVNIQLHMVFFNPVREQAFILTDAGIKVHYRIEEPISSQPGSRTTDAQNIILTTNNFQQAATLLKNIHESDESVSTEIITKEWIGANYAPATPTTTPGYATNSSNPVNANYDYDLAKKIIAYLLDETAHPNLESITILGDADIIPPGYFFYVSHYDDYNNWIASDMHYASPDYDMILNYQVGRLPASNDTEANHLVSKIQNWVNNLSPDWFYNAELIGGIPFYNIFMYGETICLDPVNKDWLKGFNIGKKFYSLGKENIPEVLPLFSEENTGMILHIGHGSGSELILGSIPLSYSQMMGLDAANKYPVLFSIACLNGGYDAELMEGGSFTNCFAEGVLRSQAGGIGYFGGTRVNYGVPDVSMNASGQTYVGDEPYMAKMLTSCFEAYAEQHTSLGSIYNEAFDNYMLGFNDQDMIDYVTAYEFVLLGDPVLNLLPSQGNSYTNAELTTDPTPFVPGGGAAAPVFYYTNDFSLPLEITGETNSSFVNLKLYEVETGGNSEEILSSTDNEVPFELPYEINQENLYQTRFETEDFKESWLYFTSEQVDNIPPIAPVLSEIDYPTNTYDLSWTKSIDYDGEVVSYSILEMKNPVATNDDCEDFDLWDNNGFSIDPNGNNSGNCFYSNTGNNFSSLITTSYPVLISEGDVLTFWKKYNTEPGFDFAYVEISENGWAFDILERYDGVSTTWTETTIDLSEYTGKLVYFRFRYQTDEIYNQPGFYVDDIQPIGWFEEVNEIENLTDTTYQFVNQPIANYFYKVCAADNEGVLSKWSNTENADLIHVSIPTVHNPGHPIFKIRSSATPGNFVIECIGELPATNLQLNAYNLFGQLVYSTNITGEKTYVNLENYQTKLLLFKITGSSYEQVDKVLIR